MSFVIGLLTVIMVFTCILLILLVLIQLPKKEAGAGLAFGGGTTDALFGAGSGNVLTKVTKYAMGATFVLWMVLGGLQSHYFHREVTGLQDSYSQHQGKLPALPGSSSDAGIPAPATAPTVTPASNSFAFPATPPPAQPATSAAPSSAPAQ
jgi:preprotein translocase subunit SecG